MRTHLLAASVAAVVLGASSAQAQDATWRATPLTGIFNNPLNDANYSAFQEREQDSALEISTTFPKTSIYICRDWASLPSNVESFGGGVMKLASNSTFR